MSFYDYIFIVIDIKLTIACFSTFHCLINKKKTLMSFIENYM